MASLSEVFGVTTNSKSPSYVDRGSLDETLREALGAQKHVVIHGGSKQGKSWLRSRVLGDSESILLQCRPNSSVSNLLTEALGIIGTETSMARVHSENLQASVSQEIAELGIGVGVTASSSSQVSSVPVGQNTDSFSWVASRLLNSGRRLILEDFHYLDEEVQRELAYLLKSLYELKVFVLVIGVWPTTHMLTYFNGELDGRLWDIALSWTTDDLRKVLTAGQRALRVRFPDEIVNTFVEESRLSVSLVQRLAERYCRELGIQRTTAWFKPMPTIGNSQTLAKTLTSVAEDMDGRFSTFAQNFGRGMRKRDDGQQVYLYLLGAATRADDATLIGGYDSADLLRAVQALDGGKNIRQSDLTQALKRIDRFQLDLNVKPAVLSYGGLARKLYVVDPSYLFYRKHSQNALAT